MGHWLLDWRHLGVCEWALSVLYHLCGIQDLCGTLWDTPSWSSCLGNSLWFQSGIGILKILYMGVHKMILGIHTDRERALSEFLCVFIRY